MSHVAAITTKIDNLDCLKKACEELGLTFVEGKKTYKWYGRFMNDYHGADAAFKHGLKTEDYGKCEHVIQINGHRQGDYEIGVVRHPSGDGYSLIYDFWGPKGKKIVDSLGKGCEKLVMYYGLNVAEEEAYSQGHLSFRIPQENGNIKLRITSS